MWLGLQSSASAARAALDGCYASVAVASKAGSSPLVLDISPARSRWGKTTMDEAGGGGWRVKEKTSHCDVVASTAASRSIFSVTRRVEPAREESQRGHPWPRTDGEDE